MNVTAIGSKQDAAHFASFCHRTLSRYSTFRRLAIFASAALITGIFAAAPQASAQATAQFSYAEIPVPMPVTQPYGVAIDANGNVYVADSSSGQVFKEKLNGSSYTQSVVAKGLSHPEGVAVDASGNVYIADSSSAQVLKETVSGGSYTQSIVWAGTAGLDSPNSVAVDGKGDVYFANPGVSEIAEVAPVGSTYVATAAWLVGGPAGIALDGNGNIYVAVPLQEEVQKITPTGPSSDTESTVANGLDEPQDVALDESGNLYVTDAGNGKLLKETPNGNTYTQSLIIGGLNQPQGVAVDANGDVYVSESASGNVLGLETSGVNFGTAAVGSATTGPMLTFTINSSVTLGAPKALTMGATGLDFNVAGGTCVSGAALSAGSTCAVTVAFTPEFAGARKGAVELTDSTGAVIATAYIYGTGLGPQIAFWPPASSNIVSGLSAARGVAVDGSGNLYIADSTAGQIVKETLSGSSYTQSVLASGLDAPYYVAVDGAGNLYLTDGDGVLKETLSGGSYTQSVVTSGMTSSGVAVDGSGNVYVTDADSSSVLKETPSGSSYTAAVVASGLGMPLGAAVDGSGNVYVADSSGNRVLKEAPGNGTYTQSVVASGLDFPKDLAVDGNGNVYIVDDGGVWKETLNGGSYSQSSVFGNLDEPIDLAVDGNGSIYVAFQGAPYIVKGSVTDPPSLSFAATAVGSQSSDSPQTVAIENIGNQPLTFPTPTTGTNPAIEQNFSYDSTSTCIQTDPSSATAFTLAPGTSCSLGIDFIPTSAGSLSGQADLIDNNQNAPAPGYALQTIMLSGTAEQIVLSPASGALPAATVGTGYNQALKATGGASPYTFTATGVPAGLTLSTVGVLSGTPTAAGSSSISVTIYDANGLTATATYTLTVNQAAPVTPPDFSLTSGGAQSQTVNPGGKATYSFSVSPIGGSYPSDVTFTATGLPAGATASFSPSTVAANGGQQNISLTIQTATTTTATDNESGSLFGGARLAFCFLLFPLLGVRKVRKQLLRHGLRNGAMLLLLVVIGAAGMATLSGCGGGASSGNSAGSGTSASSGGSQSQPAKAYTVTVTATSGSASHSFNVNLNLQ